MVVYALWYGGTNYSDVQNLENAEKFNSIKEAKIEFSSRLNGFSPRLEVKTPCVNGSARMFLYQEKPIDFNDYIAYFSVGPNYSVRYTKLG